MGRRSNLINVLALAWTVFICAIMIMPPNALAGISMAVVLAVLYALHRFTGPHEIRKPTWAAAEDPVTPVLGSGQASVAASLSRHEAAYAAARFISNYL